MLSELTLNVRIHNKEYKSPLQSLWRGLTARQEQIQTAQNQVILLKAHVSLSVVLLRKVEQKHIQFLNMIYLKKYLPSVELNVSTVLFPP